MRRSLLILVLGVAPLFIAGRVVAFQQIPRDTVKAVDTVVVEEDQRMEELLEQATEDAEDSQLLDLLQRLEEDPLEVNDASVEDLQLIPGITPVIARRIVEAREQYGDFKFLSDLQTIEGVDARLYAVMKRYLRVMPPTPTKLAANYRSRASRDLKERKGFRDGTYSGSAWKSYSRFFGNYSPYGAVGFLVEKDAGEKRFDDFLSGFVSLKTKNSMLKVVLGDYLVEVAQGMTVWRSLAFSKGLDVIQPAKKSPRGIAPYISTDENNFFRGGAAVVTLDPVELTAFYSNKRVDATVDTLGSITSVYGVGTHRTQSELRRRHNASERAAGGRVQVTLGKFFRLGSTYYSTRFDKPFLETELYRFSGRENHVVGADFDLLWDRVNLFGEWARSHTGAIGGISGAFIRVSKSADVVVSVRNYPKDFISLHGYAFGERNGTTQNEFGIYSGLRLRVTTGVLLSAYFDQFKFPWRTSTIPFPIKGSDFLFSAELRPLRRFFLEAKYKSEIKGDPVSTTDSFGRSVVRLADRAQRNGRLTASFEASKLVRLRGRVELVKVEYSEAGSPGKGILFYQDVRWKPMPSLTVDARLIFFDTDSYDARIYEFESDLRGTLFNPALYGKGRRWYVIARYNIIGGLDLSAKYSETYRDDLKRIGSGADELPGNIDNRFSAQLDIRF
jgi:hypothetical protein